MSELQAHPDPLEALAAMCLDRSRTARKAVLDGLRPNLARRHRVFVEYIAQAMTRSDLFGSRFLANLEALIEVAESEAERGTRRAEVRDPSSECVSGSTWTETRRTPEADVIAGALADIRELLALLHALHDATAAERIVRRLG